MGILEGATAQLVSVWFLLGAIAAVIVSLFTPNIWIQIAVFIVVSAVSLAVTRPLVKKITENKKIRTNADGNVGRTAVVSIQIDNNAASGQVSVDGKIWTARSEDGSVIPKDALVVVKKIDGVKLIVALPN